MRLEVLIRNEKRSEETSRPRHMRAVEMDHEEPTEFEMPVVPKASSEKRRSTTDQSGEKTNNKGNGKKNAHPGKGAPPVSGCLASELPIMEEKFKQMSRIMQEVTESVKGLQLKVDQCMVGRTPPAFIAEATSPPVDVGNRYPQMSGP